MSSDLSNREAFPWNLRPPQKNLLFERFFDDCQLSLSQRMSRFLQAEDVWLRDQPEPALSPSPPSWRLLPEVGYLHLLDVPAAGGQAPDEPEELHASDKENRPARENKPIAEMEVKPTKRTKQSKAAQTGRTARAVRSVKPVNAETADANVKPTKQAKPAKAGKAPKQVKSKRAAEKAKDELNDSPRAEPPRELRTRRGDSTRSEH